MLLAAAAGARVSGCDAGGPSQYSPALHAAGLAVEWRHDPGHVVRDGRPVVDLIAVSKALTSVAPDQPELHAAHAAGIAALSCQQLIADAAATRGQALVAVSGTHGKSTTTGWVVHLLAEAGLDPSAFVGALLPARLTGGTPSVVRLGSGVHFVVEADEYAGNFDPYRPAIAVLLNADWDHPDVFADRAAVEAAFETWLRRAAEGPQPPLLAANAADPGVASLLPHLADWRGHLLATEVVGEGVDPLARRRELEATYPSALGTARALIATYAMEPGGETRLRLFGDAFADGGAAVTLRLVGRHNADDALGAAAGALAAGASAQAVLDGLASFTGVGRRFELKGDVAGVVVLDDFGHHPHAIEATMAAVRQRYPGRRLWAVYEPLTFHRTAVMLEAFAEVLARAERVAIADIFAVRDRDTTIVQARDLAAAVAARGTPAEAPCSVEATADFLADAVAPGDVVLVMGGGRSYVTAERLVAHLREREPLLTKPS
jgi:UDP-N-acetylmuramate-alanine ligase